MSLLPWASSCWLSFCHVHGEDVRSCSAALGQNGSSSQWRLGFPRRAASWTELTLLLCARQRCEELSWLWSLIMKAERNKNERSHPFLPRSPRCRLCVWRSRSRSRLRRTRTVRWRYDPPPYLHHYCIKPNSDICTRIPNLVKVSVNLLSF